MHNNKNVFIMLLSLFVVCNIAHAMELSSEFYHENSEMSFLMRAIEKKQAMEKIEFDTSEESEELSIIERKNGKTSGTKNYFCKRKDCTFSSNHKNRITKHCEMHKIQDTGVKMYHCDRCNYLTDTQRNLNDHNISHDDKKQYHCKICDVWFKSASSRSRHNNTSVIHKQNSKNRPLLVLTNG